MTKMNKSYSEMMQLRTFKERFEYLKLKGYVGEQTFGYERYLNQVFYKSKAWLKLRQEIIIRDNGCDLGISDRVIFDRIYIHHINPITPKDIEENSRSLLDPENVICVSKDTHLAIHYGDYNLINNNELIVRTKNDTCPWKNGG